MVRFWEKPADKCQPASLSHNMSISGVHEHNSSHLECGSTTSFAKASGFESQVQVQLRQVRDMVCSMTVTPLLPAGMPRHEDEEAWCLRFRVSVAEVGVCLHTHSLVWFKHGSSGPVLCQLNLQAAQLHSRLFSYTEVTKCVNARMKLVARFRGNVVKWAVPFFVFAGVSNGVPHLSV